MGKVCEIQNWIDRGNFYYLMAVKVPLISLHNSDKFEGDGLRRFHTRLQNTKSHYDPYILVVPLAFYSFYFFSRFFDIELI